MARWPRFADPLYRLFDWPQRSETSDDLWFQQLLRDETRVYFSIDDEVGHLIGRISLREIEDQESARLGIGFAPDAVSKGYGTEALQVFLRYYFLKMGFQRMVLDVAAANERAVRCYKRCGFKSVSTHYQYAGTEDEVAFLEEETYRDLQPLFKRDRYRTLMLAYDMVLEREQWLRMERQNPSVAR